MPSPLRHIPKTGSSRPHIPPPATSLPADIELHTDFESAQRAAAATVHDKQNVGRLVRYYLRFDDGVVSPGAVCLRVCLPA